MRGVSRRFGKLSAREKLVPPCMFCKFRNACDAIIITKLFCPRLRLDPYWYLFKKYTGKCEEVIVISSGDFKGGRDNERQKQ